MDFEEMGDLVCLENFEGYEIANFKLEDLAAPAWNDDGDGVLDEGDTVSYTLPDLPTSDSGFYYINMHLDFGFEGTTEWSKSGTDGVDAPNTFDPDLNPDLNEDTTHTIRDYVDSDPLFDGYDFSANINGGTAQRQRVRDPQQCRIQQELGDRRHGGR